VEGMPRNGIAARKQAELKNRRIRSVGPGRPPISLKAAASRPDQRRSSAAGVLRRVIDVPVAAPAAPQVAIRTLDSGGRFRLDTVSELGWEPGVVLAVSFDGPWMVITPGPGETKASRRVSFDKSQRLSIPHGLRARLGVAAGSDLVVRLYPDNASVAVAPVAVVATTREAGYR